MHLLYSAGSPFARLVRIALLETGLDALVTKDELTRTQLCLRELLVLNPVGACRHWNWTLNLFPCRGCRETGPDPVHFRPVRRRRGRPCPRGFLGAMRASDGQCRVAADSGGYEHRQSG